ncbi:hypothetical protein SCAB_32471 [Streptomyces scabiei 87.22]|uniref:Uncharacterized protein n=1 Tax=Streptomyces scabiei (strain 87.22) TaxID=680198 RepID=C9ZDJ0_STRSW|nr:hypothetical protein SCAB_32471 [Streptomyces scabiei 87.22]
MKVWLATSTVRGTPTWSSLLVSRWRMANPGIEDGHTE